MRILLGIALLCLCNMCMVASKTINRKCYEAKTCIHSGVPRCGVDGTYRMFLDSCDMLEYNCLFQKDYRRTPQAFCRNSKQHEPGYVPAVTDDDDAEGKAVNGDVPAVTDNDAPDGYAADGNVSAGANSDDADEKAVDGDVSAETINDDADDKAGSGVVPTVSYDDAEKSAESGVPALSNSDAMDEMAEGGNSGAVTNELVNVKLKNKIVDNQSDSNPSDSRNETEEDDANDNNDSSS